MTESGRDSTLIDQLDAADTGPIPAVTPATDLSELLAAPDQLPDELPDEGDPEADAEVDPDILTDRPDRPDQPERADTDELPMFGPDGRVMPRPEPEIASPSRHALTHPVSVLVAAVVGGGLAVGFDHSSRTAAIAVAVAQALLIASWVFARVLAGRISGLVIGAGAAVSADILITHRPHGELGALLAVVGLAPAVLFAYQLIRGRRRANVVTSLSGLALLVVAITALAALLQLRHQVAGPAMTVAVVLCITAAAVAGHLVDWIWSPLRFDPQISRGLPALIGSVIAGAVVTAVRFHNSSEFTGQRAIIVGAATAVIAGLFAVGAAFIEPTATAFIEPGTAAARIAQVARPVFTTLFVFAFTAPFAYLLCLALQN